MATPITMPKLGLTMKRGKVVKWHKRDGERVEKGDLLVVVMSKKITYEIDAPASGTVRILTPSRETRDIAQPIGFILEPGESLPETHATPSRVKSARQATQDGGSAPAGLSRGVYDSEGASQDVYSSPAARRLAEELGVDIEAVAQARGEGPIKERDVRGFHEAQEAAHRQQQRRREVRSSPAARRLARELGVEIAQVARMKEEEGPITESDVQYAYDRRRPVLATPLARRMVEEEGLSLSKIEGSGPGGKVTEQDVLSTLETPTGVRTIPFAGMREAIAEEMMESLRSTAQLTLTARADVTQMVSLRDELRDRWDEPITYNDLIIKAVALALGEHPLLNSTLTGEGIVLLPDINIGVAVALQEGLIVPVVRAADKKSLLTIHREVRDLAERARAGTLTVDQVAGGSFTVTNLGVYGVDSFTPILNQPQAAILGVGRIAREPSVVGDYVVPRWKLTLSLTIDHRVIDGAPGGAFLQTVVKSLKHPALIFAAGSSHD